MLEKIKASVLKAVDGKPKVTWISVIDLFQSRMLLFGRKANLVEVGQLQKSQMYLLPPMCENAHLLNYRFLKLHPMKLMDEKCHLLLEGYVEITLIL